MVRPVDRKPWTVVFVRGMPALTRTRFIAFSWIGLSLSACGNTHPSISGSGDGRSESSNAIACVGRGTRSGALFSFCSFVPLIFAPGHAQVADSKSICSQRISRISFPLRNNMMTSCSAMTAGCSGRLRAYFFTACTMGANSSGVTTAA